MNPNHVIFEFGKEIPADAQGRVMLAAEKMLRQMGVKAECYKATKPDDSKLRRFMTIEERAKL